MCLNRNNRDRKWKIFFHGKYHIDVSLHMNNKYISWQINEIMYMYICQF